MEADKDDDDTVYINEDEIQELLDQAEYVIFSDLSPTNLIGPRFALTVSPPLPILIGTFLYRIYSKSMNLELRLAYHSCSLVLAHILQIMLKSSAILMMI